jgi:hypothetical protein
MSLPRRNIVQAALINFRVVGDLMRVKNVPMLFTTGYDER